MNILIDREDDRVGSKECVRSELVFDLRRARHKPPKYGSGYNCQSWQYFYSHISRRMVHYFVLVNHITRLKVRLKVHRDVNFIFIII